MTRETKLVLLTFGIAALLVYALLNLPAVLSWIDTAVRVFRK